MVTVYSREIVEPYLPADWLRNEAMSELQRMDLIQGELGNYIAIHLRLWGLCFKRHYYGNFTLDVCCCGHDTQKLGLSNTTALEKRLGKYIKDKMKEAGAKHALILAHPIMNKISNNTDWIDGSKVMIWPRTDYKERHPLVTTIIQQYMMAIAKETFVSTPKSTIVTPVEVWRSYYNLSSFVPMELKLSKAGKTQK